MPTSHRLRAIAPAVAGVIAASALLSGCLGDDKDKGATAPSVTSTAATGKPTAPSTKVPGGSTIRPTGSSTATADVIDAFTYKTGQCIQIDGRKTDEVSCSKSHNGQVGKAFDLPASVTPDTPGYEEKVSDLCEQYIGDVVNRQPASAQITFSYTYPLDMDSWNDGQRQAACIYQRKDEQALPTLIK
jgi:putative regulator of septum formation